MSRIGNKPIIIPEGVNIDVKGADIVVNGQKGILNITIDTADITVAQEGEQLLVTRKNELKENRAKHGLYRSLLQGMVTGVTDGFKKSLEIRGVGYRVAHKGDKLEFNLGFSHPVIFPIDPEIKIEIDAENNNILHVFGTNKQIVGHVSAKIRSLKKPEPYKGKGIRFVGEHIAMKAGKSASK